MTVTRPVLADVEGVLALGESLGVRDYQVFFPVETGRGSGPGQGNPREYEDLIREVLLRYRESNLRVRPTCAPQFRRIAEEAGIENPGWSRGCMAGISYCRIYATGEVTPCPYLPVSAGNLRTTPFARIWQDAENSVLARFRAEPRDLSGKCGRCDYRDLCGGGCRVRAYGAGGDLAAEDPFCFVEE